MISYAFIPLMMVMEEYLSNFDLVTQNKMKKIIYKLKLFDVEKSEA